MTRRRLWPVLSLLLAVSSLGLVPLQAQEEELPKEDPPPWGDLVSYEDPSLKQEDPLFGEPLEPYEGSEKFLELPLTDDEIASAPAAYIKWDPLNCANFTAGRTVRPIRLAAANPRYFSFDKKPLILVGASADAGCLLRLNEIDQCSLSKYPTTFTLNENLSAMTRVPLNKVRVWVAMGQGYPGAQQVPNSPFLWVAPAGQTPYWLLSDPGVGQGTDYQAFFDRLRDVLNEARKHNLFVEVTFFAPYEGKDFDLGPWSKAGGRSKAPGPAGPLSPAGFSAAQYQVLNDTSSPAAAENERMRAYQAAIIQWTVKTLWCFDNVIFEIANEPEGRGPGGKAVYPLAVSAWQKSMILEVRRAESSYLPRLEYGHLIAAQPFSIDGAKALLAPYNPPGWTPNEQLPLEVQVLNGHYTIVASSVPTFAQSGAHSLNAGALDLLRNSTLNKKRIPFGFNETTITNLIGERGTKSHLNGVVVRGGPESARAEAWEFFFSGGTAYDHYGYLGLGDEPNETSKKIRIQLGSLLDLYGKRLFDLPAPKPTLTDFGTAKMANWFTAGAYEGWECRTKSQRLWAALETTVKNPANPAQTAYRALLLYLHHSTRRCKNDSEDFTNACVSGYIPFGSYDARVWTASPPAPPAGCPNVPAGQPGYRETFTLSPGTYDVSWINPENTLPYAGSPATQTVTCSAACAITSPVYKFDILLKLVKR